MACKEGFKIEILDAKIDKQEMEIRVLSLQNDLEVEVVSRALLHGKKNIILFFTASSSEHTARKQNSRTS